MKFAALVAAGAVAAATSIPAVTLAQNAPAISVNGRQVTFDQPPVERAGRVYVPLRGVFEQLGASVVYQNGQINATRGSTTVSLSIGNTTATVNGQQQQLDSPPFLMGARTLVPLRFVAQALGATVSYDPSSNSVAILQRIPNQVVTPVPQAPPPRELPPPPPQGTALELVRPEPAPGSTVDGLRPQVAATFPGPVRADSLRIRLDGRDVTSSSYVSDRGFSYNPQYDLPYGRHRVLIEGQLADGTHFRSELAFTNRAVPQANFFRGLEPQNGTRVGEAFTVHGFTRPGSHVHMVATATDRLPFAQVQQSSAIADAVAGPDGQFAHDLAVASILPNSTIDVRVTSRAPDGATVEAVLHLRP